MPPRLIINADDFGLTPGINRAIIELHQAGVVTSATLMATEPAFDNAVALALATPTLGVGVHIVLVDGSPASPPESIRTLLGPDCRRFRPTLISFVRDLFLGRIDEADIAREALAQIEKLRGAGVNITHLDTHKHTHAFPQVARPLLSALERTGIAALRNPFEPASLRLNLDPPFIRRTQLAVLNRFRPAFKRLAANTVTTEGTLGIAATGSLSASSFQRLLASWPQDGTFELCCHPGYNDGDLDRITTRLRVHREIEREALLAVVPQIFSLPNAPELIHYGDLVKHL